MYVEVLERDIYKRPRHIVGLTAFSDIERGGCYERFVDDLWLVIQYDQTSDVWVEQLQRKVRHILLAKRTDGAIVDHGAYLCVVTALPAPELSAVLAIPWQWKVHDTAADGTVYHKGMALRDGEQKGYNRGGRANGYDGGGCPCDENDLYISAPVLAIWGSPLDFVKSVLWET